MITKVTEISCKSALSPSGLPGLDYALNPYRGCAHGCKYCYAPNIMRIPRKEWGRFVEAKRNIPKILANELKKKKKGVVGISTTTDPYQPAEKKYRLTRYCLKQLAKHDFPVSILTKSPLVTRDLDIYPKFSEVEIGFSITTNNDKERKIMEPVTKPIHSRIDAMTECSRRGITTYAFFGPLYPTMDEEGLRELVGEIKKAGVTCIMVDRLNLKPGVWSSVSSSLDDNPAVLKIWKEAAFGEGRDYKNHFKFLKEICRNAGIQFENAWISTINP